MDPQNPDSALLSEIARRRLEWVATYRAVEEWACQNPSFAHCQHHCPMRDFARTKWVRWIYGQDPLGSTCRTPIGDPHEGSVTDMIRQLELTPEVNVVQFLACMTSDLTVTLTVALLRAAPLLRDNEKHSL